ncbi:tRNA (adenosine(37)-N6)-threonylcarbamoyltransferase complex transferase subunit TsaD [Sandaracinomonas limnophila]|uniref:tRNA N6-adenosine threonylcarbamoyltransferase n=1 Tax=Sandaracinomonas limnophila TaxID=1862386 RepID=A0A437PRM1_9BACT|nr:tRNA (adenosine(37)-N6)-threonylcarbamoyltransferase complex transferase subunit TsaD [Sandaracinomonas limnophila]RVU24880.1 tRNA (adenosine(37)-N6)-threonylcarbamoyltransferase complex transferase subunit TsaD [Sandaracinomonas limnophila]
MILLAIESSCDETSAAVMVNGELMSNVISTQLIHTQWGGVVPELASREHQKAIIPVVEEALHKANISKNQLNAIAFTRGPGLLGALLVGTSFAKSLALSLNIPLIEVNHMQAHVLAHFIEEPKPKFPFICLTVSGGHTQLVWVKSALEMEIIGETLDDAVGEAFDKTAKLIGLPYPGGPLIDKLAKEGNPLKFAFPMGEIQGLNYSFSGIKTSILYFLQRETKNNPNFIEENKADICASVQHTLIEILLKKAKRAMREMNCKQIAIAGGVSANSGLRNRLQEMGSKEDWDVFIPAFSYCTDNAGMIAMAGHFKGLAKEYCGQDVSPMPRMEI